MLLKAAAPGTRHSTSSAPHAHTGQPRQTCTHLPPCHVLLLPRCRPVTRAGAGLRPPAAPWQRLPLRPLCSLCARRGPPHQSCTRSCRPSCCSSYSDVPAPPRMPDLAPVRQLHRGSVSRCARCARCVHAEALPTRAAPAAAASHDVATVRQLHPSSVSRCARWRVACTDASGPRVSATR